jgi:hypothetical protein
MSNIDSHRRSADMFNSRDWDGFAADLAENCELVDQGPQHHGEGAPAVPRARAGLGGRLLRRHDHQPTLPRCRHSTVMLFTGRGHNDGPMGPLPATGREASVPFCEIREYDTDGKVVRTEWYYDQLTMLTQLGHMQPPAE